MTTATPNLLLWIPRIGGILVTLFLAMFALDAFAEGKPFSESLPDFVVHLVPAFALLGIVAASFRWPLVGAASFIGLALVYAVTMSRGRLDWMLTISGPLLLVGTLFLWSWFRRPSIDGH